MKVLSVNKLDEFGADEDDDEDDEFDVRFTVLMNVSKCLYSTTCSTPLLEYQKLTMILFWRTFCKHECKQGKVLVLTSVGKVW